MICQSQDHVWVEGDVPTTFGARVVDYCGVCGLVAPVGPPLYSGAIQTTLGGWQKLLSHPVKPQGATA